MLKTRVVTILLLLLPFLAALFYLPVQGWMLLALLVTLFAAREWARLAQTQKSAELLFVIAVIACCSVLIPTLKLFDNKIPTDDLSLAIYALALAFWLLAAPLWLTFKWRANKIGLALSGLLVLVTAWLALVQLREISPWLVLWLLSVVWVADTAAFFCGKKFGKRKLAPDISPGKTLEGVYGAFFAVSVYAIAIIAFSGNYYVNVFGRAVPAYLLVAAHWFITGLSIVGDLFESLLKRQAGVKDSGTIFPGHGGVLDRIDGLVSTLPVMAFFIFYGA